MWCSRCGYGSKNLKFSGPWKNKCPHCNNTSVIDEQDIEVQFYIDVDPYQIAREKVLKNHLAGASGNKTNKHKPESASNAEDNFKFVSSKKNVTKIVSDNN
jgi:hypothetical protein